MEDKWTCQYCGAENGAKDAVDGKFVCWKCGAVPGSKPVEIFSPNHSSRDSPASGEGAPADKTPEFFPIPDSLEETTGEPTRGGTDEQTKTGNASGDANEQARTDKTISNKDFEKVNSEPRSRRFLWLGVLVAILLAGGIWIGLHGTTSVSPLISAPLSEGLRYVEGVEVSLYELPDGYAPESMALKGKLLYFTQDGGLFYLRDGTVNQIPLPDGWEADKVRVWEDEEAYVLTRPKLEDGAYYYTILRVRADSYVEDDLLSVHFLAGEENVSANITDFAVPPSGDFLWYITRDRNAMSPDKTDYLLGLCPYNRESGCYEVDEEAIVPALFEFRVSDKNEPRMVFDEAGNLYITAPEDAFVKVFMNNGRKLEIFAGTTIDEPSDNDGNDPSDNGSVIGVPGRNDYAEVLFQYPTALTTDNQYLYILDSGTVRRIPLDGVPEEGIETLAGNITENARTVSAGTFVNGKDALLVTDNASDLIINADGNLLLSAPEDGVVYQISK